MTELWQQKLLWGVSRSPYMCQKMIFEVGNDIILLFLCTENFHQWNWNWYAWMWEGKFSVYSSCRYANFHSVVHRRKIIIARTLFFLFKTIWCGLQAHYKKEMMKSIFVSGSIDTITAKSEQSSAEINVKDFFCLYHLMVTFQYIFFQNNELAILSLLSETNFKSSVLFIISHINVFLSGHVWHVEFMWKTF